MIVQRKFEDRIGWCAVQHLIRSSVCDWVVAPGEPALPFVRNMPEVELAILLRRVFATCARAEGSDTLTSRRLVVGIRRLTLIV